jgi:hypothetical protein
LEDATLGREAGGSVKSESGFGVLNWKVEVKTGVEVEMVGC